jgi:hypothetical protein
MLITMNNTIKELYEMYKRATDDKTRDMIQKQIDQLLDSQGKQDALH